MFHCLRLAALTALCAVVGSVQAQTTPPSACAQAPALYAAGELKTAFRLFFACAIDGHAASAYSAAMMMRSGESNDAGEPNPYGARVFLEHAAAQGYIEAIYALGKEYDVGSTAFRRDLNAATRFFAEAAWRGHVDAQVDLATQYLLGRGGVPQDDSVAAHWYERAAAAGHWGAQFLIASMYENGNGVGRDELAALRWYERAQAGGDEIAPLKVVQLRQRLTSAAWLRRFD